MQSDFFFHLNILFLLLSFPAINAAAAAQLYNTVQPFSVMPKAEQVLLKNKEKIDIINQNLWQTFADQHRTEEQLYRAQEWFKFIFDPTITDAPSVFHAYNNVDKILMKKKFLENKLWILQIFRQTYEMKNYLIHCLITPSINTDDARQAAKEFLAAIKKNRIAYTIYRYERIKYEQSQLTPY